MARRAGYRLGARRLGARRQAPGGLPHEPLRARSTRSGRARPTGSGSRTSTAVPGRRASPSSTGRTRRSARDPDGIARVQVTHPRDGGARRRGGRCFRSRVHRIPIGIELERFSLVSRRGRERRARSARPPAGRRSSSGRSRRTGSGWGDGLEPKTIKGPDVLVAASRAVARRESATSSSCSRGRRAATSGRELERPGSRTFTGSSRIADGLAPAYHALDAYLVAVAAGGRPEERARVHGDGHSARHDPGGPGAGPRRGRPQRAPRRRRGRRRRSPRALARVHDDADVRRLAHAPGGRPRRERPRAPRTALGGAARGIRRSVEMDRERARPVRSRGGALGTAPRRRPAPGPGSASSTAGTASPSRASRSPAARPSCRSSRRAGPNTPTDFSLLYLGTTYLPRDLAPLLWLAEARREGRRQPGRRRLPGWAGDADRRAQRAAAPRGPRCRPRRSTRASSASARSDRFLGEPQRAVGDPPERRRRRLLHARCRAPVDGPACSSAATRRRSTAWSSRSRRSGTCWTRIPTRGCSSAGASSPIRSRRSRRLGLAAAVELTGRYAQREAPDVFRSAHVLLHTKVNDPARPR